MPHDQLMRSTPYDVNESLFDTVRTNYFDRAIKEAVRAGDVVVDAGSGTGVLGMLAAKYGASRVYCIEAQERFCEVIQQNAINNGLQDRIVVINADVTTCHLPEKVDLIVGEIISGGFFFEPQIQAVNNLRMYLKDGGTVLPCKMNTYVELMNAEEELYGLKFNYDSRCVAHIAEQDESLTSRAEIHVADFNAYVSPDMDWSAVVTGTKKSVANAVRISYTIDLTPTVVMREQTPFLMRPEVIFLPEKVDIAEGGRYTVSAKYLAGTDTLATKIVVTKV